VLRRLRKLLRKLLLHRQRLQRQLEDKALREFQLRQVFQQSLLLNQKF
jgi:hypothetical protein